ncbi:MAG: hypothetical protein ACM3NQ_02350 [Bacteroidales bacterium]
MNARARVLIALGVLIVVIFLAASNAAAQITVTAASPSSAARGTTSVSVTVNGKNFKANSKVTGFYRVDSTNTGGVVVGATTYKRSSQLIVVINVPDEAERGSYDIVVTTGSTSVLGRALFTVLPKAVPACTPGVAPVPTSDPWPSGPGSRDVSFASNGVVTGPKFMEVTAVAIQRFGEEERIVTVGSSYDKCAGGNRVWTIARYHSNGELDDSFGTQGVVTKAFAKGSGYLYAVAIDFQSRIVVGGYLHLGSSANYGAVARFSPEGVLDTAFAPDGLEPGIRSLSLERYMSEARAIVIQQDGKILIAGTDGGAMAVFRLTENGAWDTDTFNAAAERPQLPGRYVYLGVPGLVHGPGCAYGVAIQEVDTQERIVVAGKVNVQRPDQSVDTDGAVWRFTMDGQLDTTFRTYGVVVTDIVGTYDVFQAMALDASGKIVVTGSKNQTANYLDPISAMLLRYDVDGTLDSTFNGGSPIVVRQPGWTTHYAYALAIDSNGNIVVGDSSVRRDAGNATVAEGAGLWRFTRDGEIDASFGPGGWIVDTLLTGVYGGSAVDGQYGTWNGLTRQADGKVIAAGKSTWGAYYPVLARFWQ